MNPAARVALVSTLASALLGVAKILTGIAARSTATVSDGIESSGDVLTSGMVFLALRLASKPPDEDHPYGHGRADILAGLGIGMVLLLAAAGICWRAVTHNPGTPALFAIYPLAASIAIKGGLAFIKMRIGKNVSSALVADAWNDSADIFSGAVALVAVLLAVYLPGWQWADRFGGFVIGIIVLFIALRTIYETSLQLMDTMPAPAQVEELRRATLEVPGALGVEKCFARKTGHRYHVDLHLEVDPKLTVLESHRIASAVKLHLRRKIEWVEDVLVHVEPYGMEEEHGKPGNRAPAL